MPRHILVINRADNVFGAYQNYIDHDADRVAYVVDRTGSRPIDHERAEAVIELEDLSDRATVTRAAVALEAAHGPFDRLIAQSEFDLELAAEIRGRLGVSGTTAQSVLLVRDKVVMKRAIDAAGLRVPYHEPVETTAQVREFVAEHGLPLVIKPRCGADSQGVHIVRSRRELERVLALLDPAGAECEELIEGELLHIDGLVVSGQVRAVRGSRCIGTCLDFARGLPFASVGNDDLELEHRVRAYAATAAETLELENEAFHLEAFRTATRPDPSDPFGDLVFLELGARAGGGQVRHVWREVYGIDLVGEAVRAQLGDPVSVAPVDPAGELGGYVMIPQPRLLPCRVRGASSLVDTIASCYAEDIPAPGTILDGHGGARDTGGCFRFRAGTRAEIVAGIDAALVGYRLDYEPAVAVAGSVS
jgi:biotin carboxylase